MVFRGDDEMHLQSFDDRGNTSRRWGGRGKRSGRWIFLIMMARAGPEKSESVRDSRIGRIMIHHVGWKGGRHGWQNPIRRIYVTAWYWRFYQVNPGAMWLAGLMSVRAA